MKKIIIATALLLFGEMVSSQNITNSKLTSDCSESGYDNNVNCVKGWNASHGNPAIKGTIGKNTWAWMWSHSDLGSGIMTNYNFESGKTYQITFKIKTGTNISKPNEVVLNSTANVRAVSGMISMPSNSIPDTVASEVIWSEPIKTTLNGWQVINVNFTAQNNNAQLWFYPSMTADTNANGGARIEMEIDDVVITPMSKQAHLVSQDLLSLSQNPMKKGEFMRITTNTKEVKEIMLVDLQGNTKTLSFSKIDNNTMEFLIDNKFKDGIYTINILNKDDTILSKKIIVN